MNKIFWVNVQKEDGLRTTVSIFRQGKPPAHYRHPTPRTLDKIQFYMEDHIRSGQWSIESVQLWADCISVEYRRDYNEVSNS